MEIFNVKYHLCCGIKVAEPRKSRWQDFLSSRIGIEVLHGSHVGFFFPWEQMFFLMQTISIVLPSNMAAAQKLYCLKALVSNKLLRFKTIFKRIRS